MNFLIIEFYIDNKDKEVPTRSIRVIDGEMSLKLLFLTYKVDIIEVLTGESHSTGDFITQVDKKCKIVNNDKIIESDTIYNNLEYSVRETDIGTVQIATIQVSLKKEWEFKIV